MQLQYQLEQQEKKSLYAEMQNSNKMNTSLEIGSFCDSVSEEDLRVGYLEKNFLEIFEKKNSKEKNSFFTQPFSPP